jgi:hypothetical protein
VAVPLLWWTILRSVEPGPCPRHRQIWLHRLRALNNTFNNGQWYWRSGDEKCRLPLDLFPLLPLLNSPQFLVRFVNL